MDIDTALLRRAFDIAANGGDTSIIPRISSVYKVLTPGVHNTKITPEVLVEHGYTIMEHGSMPNVGGRVVVCPRDGYVGQGLETRELLELAYRFALAATQGAPEPDMAEFSVFSSGLHMLAPGAKAGKKLRTALELNPAWRITGHMERKPYTLYKRIVPTNDLGLEDGELDDDCFDDNYMQCDKDEPGAKAFNYVHIGPNVLYVRPRPADQARIVVASYVEADGSLRAYDNNGFRGWPSVWRWLEDTPTFLVPDGTRVQMAESGGGEGGPMVEVLYRRGLGWLLEDGKPVPRAVWEYNAKGESCLVMWDDLGSERRAELEASRARQEDERAIRLAELPRRRAILKAE